MGKATSWILGIFLGGVGISMPWWYCNNGLNKTIKKQKITIDTLVAQKDQIFAHFYRKNQALEKSLKDTVYFYSDTLVKTVSLYHATAEEKEKINKKLISSSHEAKKYKKLAAENNRKAENYDKLFSDFKELKKVHEKEIAQRTIEKNINNSFNLENKAYAGSENISSKDKKSLLSYIFSPKLEILDNEILIRSKNAREMEAFAIYLGTVRKEPLIKESQGDNIAIFKCPKKFLDENGIIDVYIRDKSGNETKKKRLYACKNVVSTKPMDCNK